MKIDQVRVVNSNISKKKKKKVLRNVARTVLLL